MFCKEKKSPLNHKKKNKQLKRCREGLQTTEPNQELI